MANRGDSFHYWNKDKPLLSWGDLDIPDTGWGDNCSLIWKQIADQRQNFSDPENISVSKNCPYGLTILLKIPNRPLNPLSVDRIKHLIDATIMQFHAHPDNDRGSRFAARFFPAVDSKVVCSLLRENLISVFGETILVKANGDPYPPDTRCKAVEILIDREERNGWTMSGELFLIDPINR